jgi:hypothetical protein
MTASLCPSCGTPLGKPEAFASYNVRCKKCGKMVHIAPTRRSNHKQDKHDVPWRKRVLIAAALGTAAVMMFAFFGPESTPAKTEFRDLNQDEVDNAILRIGMGALEDQGWTESETAFYMETRLVMYRKANKEASDAYRSRSSTSTELTAKSTASEIKDLSAADLRIAYQEIEDTKIRIRKFEQVLADYRKSHPTK